MDHTTPECSEAISSQAVNFMLLKQALQLILGSFDKIGFCINAHLSFHINNGSYYFKLLKDKYRVCSLKKVAVYRTGY